MRLQVWIIQSLIYPTESNFGIGDVVNLGNKISNTYSSTEELAADIGTQLDEFAIPTHSLWQNKLIPDFISSNLQGLAESLTSSEYVIEGLRIFPYASVAIDLFDAFTGSSSGPQITEFQLNGSITGSITTDYNIKAFDCYESISDSRIYDPLYSENLGVLNIISNPTGLIKGDYEETDPYYAYSMIKLNEFQLDKIVVNPALEVENIESIASLHMKINEGQTDIGQFRHKNDYVYMGCDPYNSNIKYLRTGYKPLEDISGMAMHIGGVFEETALCIVTTIQYTNGKTSCLANKNKVDLVPDTATNPGIPYYPVFYFLEPVSNSEVARKYYAGMNYVRANDYATAYDTLKAVPQIDQKSKFAEKSLVLLPMLLKALDGDKSQLMSYYDTLTDEDIKVSVAESKVLLDITQKDYELAIEKLEYLINNPPSDKNVLVYELEQAYCYYNQYLQGNQRNTPKFVLSPDQFSCYVEGINDKIKNNNTETQEENLVPGISEVKQNIYPNPFNPTTIISYSIPDKSEVNVTIYNLRGQKVKTLVDSDLEKGNHKVFWNGENMNDEQVASGVYFSIVRTEHGRSTKKLVLQK